MKRKLTKWGDRKFLSPIRKSIIKGISTEKLSVSLALGLILGIIPFYGVTTILVGLAALSLRLNFVTMQVAHLIVQPIQLALIVPFLKLGDTLIIKTGYIFTLQEYILLFKTDFWGALGDFWMINLSAIVIWLVVSLPLFAICYYLFKVTIARFRPALIRPTV
jgi:uncharacterized protein (DUF2062 family)